MSNPASQSASTATTLALPPQYSPAEHEGKVRARWDEAKAFHADPARVLKGEAKPYCILIPPPNVTAQLHLGHALNNTLQDILARAHRMMGFETLWMPGTDHAGIATQAVVEKRLRAEGKLKGPLKDAMKREDFVAHVQAWKDEYEAVITNQLKMMGCSCDWARQRFTMDEVCTKAVYEAFFHLFKDGLIYRGKRLVNWDPALQTAVADDECYDEEIDGAFYYLRYPLVHATSQDVAIKTGGRENVDPMPITWGELARRGYPGASEQDADQQAWATVATTRPETYLGDTAVALNPHDPRAKALGGLFVELPLIGRIIPIVTDGYVVLPKALAEQLGRDEDAKDPKAAMATGFLKVTPAHDQNDYELGQRHSLPIVNMMSPDGRVSDKHGWDGLQIPHNLLGKKMAEARKLVVEEFKSRGLMEGSKPHRHSVKHSDRSKAIVEPYLSDQWYVKVTDPKLAKAANEALDKPLTFHPARYAKTYEQWHDNIRDWCISRQLWWGHRIPVWHRRLTAAEWGAPGRPGWSEADGARMTDGSFAVLTRAGSWDSLPWDNDALVHWQPENGGEFDCFICTTDSDGTSDMERAGFVRDPDVLDTWFSSALWPMSTMGWPESTDTLKAFNPTTTLCTAREIITLWVSRMVMFNRYFMGEGHGKGPAPFRNVVIHAVIQDGEGRKMSKSLGNGIDPLDIIATHGSDAMRFTLAQMTTQTQDVRMPVQKDPTGRNTSEKFDLGKRLCNKLWNAARLSLSKLPASGAGGAAIAPASLSLPDRWMLSRVQATVAAVNTSLEHFEYSEYATALYDLLWRDFCDWYLEAVKGTIDANPAQQAVVAHTLEVILRLAHPVMPYVTESIWEHLKDIRTAPIAGITLGPSRKGGLLATAGWPTVDAKLHDAAAVAEFDRLREFITAVRDVRSKHQVPPKRKIKAHLPAALASEIGKAGAWVPALAGIASIDSTPPTAGGVAARVLGHDIHLSDLADAAVPGSEAAAAEAGSESERKAKRCADLIKEIGIIETRLNNPGYAQRAPAKLVEESKSKLQQLKDEQRALGCS